MGKATLVRPGTPIVFPSSNKMVALTSPSISGDARVGATLRADGGTWSAPSPTLTYQWLRSGTPIAGATLPTYRAKGADVGSRLAARVTAAAPGVPKVSATSPQADVVAKVTP